MAVFEFLEGGIAFLISLKKAFRKKFGMSMQANSEAEHKETPKVNPLIVGLGNIWLLLFFPTKI